jgi:hypothetical protein
VRSARCVLVEARAQLHQARDLLALSAARISDSMNGESGLVRYSVCLIVTTSGSLAAAAMNRSTLSWKLS